MAKNNLGGVFVKRAGILISTLPDLKAPIDKLGGNLNKLQNSSNEIKIESSADNDANKMAKILSKKFQTNVTVETVKAS